MKIVDMQTFLDSHNGQWRKRLLEFVIPRLIGSEADKEVVLEMIFGAVHQGHDEGVADAALIIASMKAKVTDARAIQVLGIAENALSELRRRNARDAYAARPAKSEVEG